MHLTAFWVLWMYLEHLFLTRSMINASTQPWLKSTEENERVLTHSMGTTSPRGTENNPGHLSPTPVKVFLVFQCVYVSVLFFVHTLLTTRFFLLKTQLALMDST